MPLKSQPKVFCLSVRTHKLSIMITTPQDEDISKLKEEVLSALSALTALYLHGKRVPQVPTVNAVEDFELCRAVEEKGESIKYEQLDTSRKLKVKDCFVNWDSVYIQFRDDESGDLQPVEVTPASQAGDEEEDEAPATTSNAGKRKAPE